MTTVSDPADMSTHSADDAPHIGADNYFAVIPEWVLDADISDRAIRVYCVLRRYADKDTGHARPSRAAIAERCRTSVKSVDRALRELERVGAVTITHRWSDEKRTEFTTRRDAKHQNPAPSWYTLRSNNPNPRDTGDATLGTPVSLPLGTPVTHVLKSLEPESVMPDSKKPSRRKPSVPIPDDWKPNTAHTKLARELGLTDQQARTELEQFKDHAAANDIRHVVWDRAFNTWLRNAVKYGSKQPRVTANGSVINGAVITTPDGRVMEKRW